MFILRKSYHCKKTINLLLFVLLYALPVTVFAKDALKSAEITSDQAESSEEPVSTKSHSIKEYSNGTVYYNAPPAPASHKDIQKTVSENDPGFPGDPGVLPVGDGFLLLFVAGIFYFLYKKFIIKKES